MLPNDIKNTSLYRINLEGHYQGANEKRCQKEYSSHHQTVRLTDHFLGISKFSPRKGTLGLCGARFASWAPSVHIQTGPYVTDALSSLGSQHKVRNPVHFIFALLKLPNEVFQLHYLY